MPLITCEMRWLFEGALPAEVGGWFQRGCEEAAERWREDRYLVLSGAADMGIKERDGRLEIKGRLAKLGRHAIAPGIEGPVIEGPAIEGNAERWCKWSYGAAIAARFDLQGHQAIVVGKGRVQRHFLLAPGERPQPAAQRDLSRRGFSLELTRIRLSGADYWSLGIEAAPDDPNLLADLLRALSDVLQGLPLPLPRARSQSYPAWLARHRLEVARS